MPRRFRTVFAGALGLATVAGWIVAVSGQVSLPLEPTKDTGASITGAFEGWYQNSDGTYSLLVGYMNRNLKQSLDIPVGPNNRIEPGGPDLGQPTFFEPRRQWGVFVITVPKDFGSKKLTWTIVSNGQTTTVPLNLNDLWVVEPFKDAGVGNTPPTIRFEEAGAPQQGPPKGIAASYTTTAARPLTLTAWVNDDGFRAPELRGRAGGPATLRWSKFRGPGSVMFDNESPEPDVAMAGKASVVATFSGPGEYILRAQSNDSTGEGGGGFQCCWTNAHVKVTVTP